MADYNCSACEDLRQDAPNFVVNGLGKTEIASLKNNTGLNPSSGNDDCEDLNNMNDCLVGNMENEVDAYDVCDWREFMKKFIGNLWSVLAGMIAAICGLWTNLKSLRSKVNKHDCILEKMSEGISFSVGEESTDGSYVVAGKGISFLGTGEAVGEAQVTFTYIAGGLARVQGSLLFNSEDFTDTASCWNFDNGASIRQSKSRKGNSKWNNTTGVTQAFQGGELLYEIRILKSQYPEIRNIVSGIGGPTGGGAYQVNLSVTGAGDYANGQSGSCNPKTGAGQSGGDDGHLVPDGWIYLQARMVNVSRLIADGRRYSPRGFVGIRLNSEKVSC